MNDVIRRPLTLALVLAFLPWGSIPLRSQEPSPRIEQKKGEPYYAGIGRVINPVIHAESKAVPSYPKKARRKGIQARCVLQAIIEKNGSVSKAAAMETRITYKDGTVRRVDWPRRPKEDYGFAAASEEAVVRWRYTPATLD